MSTTPQRDDRPDAGAMSRRPPRPREMQDVLNYHLYHPLAWKLARLLVPTPITPNMVSIVGGGFVVAAAIAYAQPGWPLPALIGLLLHMTWHVVDGADGDLARMTGRSSPVGELVDGICDYASHIFLYLLLGYVLQLQMGLLAWPLVVASGVSHIVQSNHYEVQRRKYQWRVYGVAWLGSTANDERTSQGGFGALRRGYLKLASKLGSSEVSPIDAALIAAQDDASRLQQLRDIVRTNSARLLARASLLSSNHRTVMLGVSMLAGSPGYYFAYQLVVLNVVLLVSMRSQRAATVRMSNQIDHLPSTLR